MLKRSKMVLLLGLYILFLPYLANAVSIEDDNDVVLFVEGQENCEIRDKQVAVQVGIEFNDIALINESLMLSYHIYDRKGNLLLFEGNRTPLNAFVDNVIQGVPVTMNFDDIDVLNGQKYIVLEFDIVDEKKLYWFSKNDQIKFKTATITYDDRLFNRMKTAVRTIVSNPFLLLLNIAIYSACVFGLAKYKKSQ